MLAAMTIHELIDTAFADMKPMLAMKGREIKVVRADDAACTIELVGFCNGGCACTQSYKEEIEELIREKMPTVKTIEFV